VANRAKSGFETAVPLPGNYKSFKVEALSAGHRVLGTSRAFAARS
jgi:hypothetical protein